MTMTTNPRVELMRKILLARLTKEETSAIKKRAQEILFRRMPKKR